MSTKHLPDRSAFADACGPDAPSTMLRMVPLPRERGRIEVAAGIAAKSSPAERGRGTAEGGGGGAAGASPCVVIHDEFGLWPLDYPLTIADGPAFADEPELAAPGTLVPTIVGVVLISTIVALALIAAWQWWQA